MEFRIWSQHVLLVVLIVCSQQRVSGRPTVKTGLCTIPCSVCCNSARFSSWATLSIRTPSSCPTSRCTHPSRSQDEELMSQGVRVRKGSGSPAVHRLTAAPATALSSHASAPLSVKRLMANHFHARSRVLASVAQS